MGDGDHHIVWDRCTLCNVMNGRSGAVVMKWSAANCNGLNGAGPRVTVFLALLSLLLRHSNCAAFEAVLIIGIITFCFSFFGI